MPKGQAAATALADALCDGQRHASGREAGGQGADPIRRQGSVMLRSALLADLLQAPWLGLQFPLEGERHHQSIADHSNLWSSSWKVSLVLVFPYEEPPSLTHEAQP